MVHIEGKRIKSHILSSVSRQNTEALALVSALFHILINDPEKGVKQHGNKILQMILHL